MGPALGVNQETVDRLLDIERRYQPGRRQLIQNMRMDYQRLQQAMSQAAPPPGEVEAILSDMKRKKQEMPSLQTRQGEEEDALLTPVQQARFLMYNQSLMREARSVKRGGPGEGGTFTPGGPPGSSGNQPLRPLTASGPGRSECLLPEVHDQIICHSRWGGPRCPPSLLWRRLFSALSAALWRAGQDWC